MGPPSGHPERFLVIVTRERMDLPIEHLCPELGSPSCASRAGAGNPWEQGSTLMESLFENELPPEDWEWGALEAPVNP